jgi:hypothetical protein
MSITPGGWMAKRETTADLDQRDRFPDLVFKRKEWSYGPPMPGHIDEAGKRMVADTENERVMRAVRDASRGNG